MNRNQIILIVVPLLLIFGYQNCQKSNFDPAATPLMNPSEAILAQEKQSIVLANESLQALEFKSSEVTNVLHGSSTISVVKNLIYHFNLGTGEFHVIDQSAQTDRKYCLSESLKENVTSLLSSSSVCKGGYKVTEGLVCAQALIEGYASIITNRDSFHLGSATDSCGSNSVDLCEGSDQLKNWFNSVKVGLAGMGCVE